MIPLSEIVGRIFFEDVLIPNTKKILIKKDELISKEKAKLIDEYKLNLFCVEVFINVRLNEGICKNVMA